jgi:ABC-type Zn uptake system ZnuABC Zn-binding protein ZnuA
VTTIHPVASVVRAVAGPDAVVHTLLPAGANPDTYQTRPRDAEALDAAELVVRVGGAADAWLSPPPGVPTVTFTDGMTLVGQRGPGTGNPHVWLDPILVRDRLLPPVTEALARVAPDSAAAIRDRARAFADSLTALDAEIRALLASAPDRRFISAHAAWVYFAARYDLEFAGALHTSPGNEPGSRALAGLVDEARARGVRAVLAEPQLGRAGVDALARELGARVEVADPLGGVEIEGREDYLSLMRFNARAFARALGADAP